MLLNYKICSIAQVLKLLYISLEKRRKLNIHKSSKHSLKYYTHGDSSLKIQNNVFGKIQD